jgi:hypothetical protein
MTTLHKKVNQVFRPISGKPSIAPDLKTNPIRQKNRPKIAVKKRTGFAEKRDST